MKIAIAQINCTVGDLAGNVARILDFIKQARTQSADLLVTPELALCGYPPEDLLLRDDFYRNCDAALHQLAAQIADIAVVVGHPRQVDGRRYNAASVIQNGSIVATYHKHTLPNYTVFDEERYFDTDDKPCMFQVNGVNFGVNICEDTWGKQGPLLANPGTDGKELNLGINICADSWEAEAPRAARAAGAQVLLVLNASPYHLRKQHSRYDVMRERVAENGMPLIYVNMVGGQDELVFDGASFVLNRTGDVTHQLPLFKEALGIVTIDNGDPQPGEMAPERTLEADVYDALCLGVRDYVTKNGFPGVLLGLSGGIDSALTLAVAADALGADKVRAVMMPSQYTASISREDARAEAEALGVRYSEIAIRPVFDSFLAALAAEFKGLPADTTEENLQSRIRGTLLMAMSNKSGAIVLTTGNKSEMGTGYATLYGDMAGGFAVLKDISKTLVYRLADYRNSISGVIPQRVITRAPSAELRPNQTDQDSLPPYAVLDAIMEAYVEHNLGPREIEASGYSRKDIERVINLLRISEYKRRQAPIGIRITPRGFGKDWRYPITNKYRHQFE
jgi:NAD+ synthase (glutamine-hydrolysing)